jgi:tRNA U34 2-thiouridine synthase MnmA/TrmU
MKKIKALALFSGGLDSILATKIILNQGINVEAVNFISPFCLCGKGGCGAHMTAKELDIPLKIIRVGNEYLKMLKNPKYGYGKNLNPCLDCRIFMFKRAKEYAKKIGASFVFTGEVLGERPMSQHKNAMYLIERESGLKNRILRPLSAKLLPETPMEKEGLVDRSKLLGIQGRSRKPQIKLAKDLKVAHYPCPSGGCLLTYKEFAKKVQDLFKYKKRVIESDITLLKLGRHFRIGSNKIIVGRNQQENQRLLSLKKKTEYYFEISDYGSPITVLQGRKNKKGIETAAGLTAFYSDNKNPTIIVNYGLKKLDNKILVARPSYSEVQGLRI